MTILTFEDMSVSVSRYVYKMAECRLLLHEGVESGHIRFFVAVDVQDFCQAVPDDGKSGIPIASPFSENFFYYGGMMVLLF